MKRRLIYYIGQASKENSMQTDLLKNSGMTVHIFENIDLLIESITQKQPDLLVIRFTLSPPSAFNIVRIIRNLHQRDCRTLPCLIIAEPMLNIFTLAKLLDLPPQNFLTTPISQEQLTKAVETAINSDDDNLSRTVRIWDPDHILDADCLQLLEQCNFDLLPVDFPILYTADNLSASQCCTILVGNPRSESLNELFNDPVESTLYKKLVLVIPDTETSVPVNWLIRATRVLYPPVNSQALISAVNHVFHIDQIESMMTDANVSHVEISTREKLYRRVVESQDDLLCKMLPDSSLTFVNRAFVKLMGKSRRMLINSRFMEYLPDEDIRQFRQKINQLIKLRKAQTHEHGIVAQGKKKIWFVWTSIPVLDDMNNVVEILSAGRDITTKKHLELQLKQESAEQELLLSSIPTHVWYLKDQQTYGRVNQAHADFFNKAVSDIADQTLDSVLPPGDVPMLVKLYRDVITSRERVYTEFLLTDHKNRRRLMAINAVPQVSRTGTVTSIVCSALDVTEQRLGEFALAYRAEFEHLITEVSATFLNHESNQLDWAIRFSLEQIAKFTGADRGFLYLLDDLALTDSMFVSWRINNDTEFEFLPQEIFSSLLTRMESLESVQLEAPADLSGLDLSERAYFLNQNIQSALYVPLEYQESFLGFIGFEAMEQSISFSDEILVLFKFYSRILLQTIQRKIAIEMIERERDLGIKLSRSTSLDESLKLFLTHAIEISRMECGGIYVFDDLTKELVLREHQGLSEKFVNAVERIPETSTQIDILRESPVFSESTNYASVADHNMLEEGLKSIGVLPVVDRQKILACVNVASRTRSSIPLSVRTALISMISRLGPTIAKAKVEEEIRSNWENLNLLLNNIDEYIFVFDLKGKIIHVNQSVTVNLDYPADDLGDLTVNDVFTSDNDTAALEVLIAAADPDIGSFERWVKDRNGRKIPAELHIVKSRWREQTVWFAFCHDLTRIKQEEAKRLDFEKQLLQARKVESLGRMAGAIAHRFNNLLMGVSGNLELAELLGNRGQDPREKIKVARETARKAIDLGKLMLTYVGQGESEQCACDLSEEVLGLLPLIRTSLRHDVTLLTNLHRTLPLILADSNGLRQIVLNLASNAWESMPDEPGTISIVTGVMKSNNHAELMLVDADRSELPDCVFLRITDTGCGMIKDDIEKIFDPFYSTKFTGRGLGLSTVQGIVKAHDGYISVVSKPRRGTEVTVLFPIPDIPPEPRRQASATEHTKLAGSKKTDTWILLVDDEEIVRQVGASMLTENGYKVRLAESGTDALDIYRKHRHDLTATVCDITMDEMDGWEVLAEIRRCDPHAKVILVSGVPDAVKPHESYPDPTGYIQKPFDAEKLLKLLEKMK